MFHFGRHPSRTSCRCALFTRQTGRHRLELLCGVGRAVSSCRLGMPESSLLFSVPAWGSFLLCSQEVEGSKTRAGRQMGRWADGCRAVGGPRSAKGGADSESRAIAGRWRAVLRKIAPRSSFPRRRESTVPTIGPSLRGDDGDFQWGKWCEQVPNTNTTKNRRVPAPGTLRYQL